MSLAWVKVKQYVLKDMQVLFERSTAYSSDNLSEAFDIFYTILSSEYTGQQFKQKLTDILQTYLEYKKSRNSNLIDEIFSKLHEDSTLETYLKSILYLCNMPIPVGKDSTAMACAMELKLVLKYIDKNTGKMKPDNKNTDEKSIEYHVYRAINIRNTKGHTHLKPNQAPDFINYTNTEKLQTIDNYFVTFLFAILQHRDKLQHLNIIPLNVGNETSIIFDSNKKPKMHEEIKPFVKLIHTPETEELLRHPNCWTLLTIIALRSQREGSHQGEALIGDIKNYGMTEGEYRGAKKKLEEWGIITSQVTNRGTIAKLVDTRIFDINPIDM